MIFLPDFEENLSVNNLVYDPLKFIELIIRSVNIIADSLNLEVSIYRLYKETDVIKHNYNHSIWQIHFSSKTSTPLQYTFEVPVLDRLSDGSFYIKGLQQFINKGLRETLFSIGDSQVRSRIFVYEADPFIDYNNNFGCIYKIDNVKTILRYYLTRYPEYFESSILLKQYQEETKLKPLTNSELQGLEKKESFKMHFKLFEIIYNLNLITKEYSTNIAELILKMWCLKKSELKFENFDIDRTGLSLIHKRIMTETEIILYQALYEILIELITLLRKQSKRAKNTAEQASKQFKKVLEPAKFLYPNYLEITQFVSPIAFYTQFTKIIIYGPAYLYLSRDIKDNHRDIHLTHLNNFCPFSTGDKDATGLSLHIAEDIEIDEYGRFVNLLEDEKSILDEMLRKGFEKLVSEK